MAGGIIASCFTDLPGIVQLAIKVWAVAAIIGVVVGVAALVAALVMGLLER